MIAHPLLPRSPVRRSGRLALGLVVLLAGCNEGGPDTLDADEALGTFELEDGYRIELFAAEPLISDPVAMEVDEHGTLYVVEMHGYPLDLSGSGTIKRLTDTDGDGRPDVATVFADSLILPNGLMRWKDGLLVTDAPDVLYLEDTDGDGRADVREVVLTGFARSNPQHNLNAPLYGLDNWIYLAHEGAIGTHFFEDEFGDRGSEVVFPGHPEVAGLPRNASGRNVRFRLDPPAVEMRSASSQFGHTFDAWGRHILTENWLPLFHEVIAAPYLQRNPGLRVSDATHTPPAYASAPEVYPITTRPEFQLLTDRGVFTSACGITWYLGGAFPEPFDQVVFIAEPVHNVVHAAVVTEQGTTFDARRHREGREFLASTDSWFRPVNFYIGPDGALYVLDYYRQIIEHPEWMSEETNRSGALYNGVDKGRIYRITREGAAPAAWLDALDLSAATDEALVEHLADPNIWRRRTAQRLLVDRGSEEAVPALAAMVRDGASAVGRAHALWTLEGLGATDPALLERALSDEVPGVREQAIQVAERYVTDTPSLAAALVAMAGDPNPRVRFQLLATLGALDTPAATDARQRMLLADVEDEWVHIAALSTPYREEVRWFETARRTLTDRETAGRRAFFERIGYAVGQGTPPDAIREMIQTAAQPGPPTSDWWRAAVLSGLSNGLAGRDIDPATWAREQALLLAAYSGETGPGVRAATLSLLDAIGLPDGPARSLALEQAESRLQDPGHDPALRVDAIRLLALADRGAYADAFRARLEPGEPASVQRAAIEELSRLQDPATCGFFVEKWPTLTPELRSEAIDGFMQAPSCTPLLLDALEAGTVQASALGWRRTVRLMNHGDDAIRNRARLLLAEEEGTREDVLARYQSVLSMNGDAGRGQAVFERACAVCHQIGGDLGVSIGPDLATVRNRSPEAIMTDVLIPSQSIADGYAFWTVEKKGGDRSEGIIATETPTTITLRDMAGRETVVPRTEIERLVASRESAMPPGLEQQIGEQEMADLLAFVKAFQ